MTIHSHLENPSGNQLSPGVTAEQLYSAVEKSGYPLQTFVGEQLRASFAVQDEWCYIDRDSGDLRSIDIRADMRLHGWTPQPRVRPQLTMLVECKQSQLPFVFFESVTPEALIDHPKINGLHKPAITISSDDDPSTWTFTVIHTLGLHTHAFQRAPAYCNTFSKCVRKGAEMELSGTDAYSGLVLPLIKALEHLSQAEEPPKTAYYFDAHLSVGLGVVDAPMILARRKAAQTELEFVPWVRVLRHEYSATGDVGERERLWAIDIVHKEYLEVYLTTHLVPFAKDFASRVLSHTTEVATGEAFAAGMGADSWHGLESRLRPSRLKAVVKRARAAGRNLLKVAKSARSRSRPSRDKS